MRLGECVDQLVKCFPVEILPVVGSQVVIGVKQVELLAEVVRVVDLRDQIEPERHL